MKFKAIRTLRYRTRRLLADGSTQDVNLLNPGDVFEVKRRKEMNVLLATKKVTQVREPVDLAPPPPRVAQKIAEVVPPPAATSGVVTPDTGAVSTVQAPLPASVPPSDLAGARTEYERVTGKKAYHAWDVAVLEAKIAETKTKAG